MEMDESYSEVFTSNIYIKAAHVVRMSHAELLKAMIKELCATAVCLCLSECPFLFLAYLIH